MAWEQPANQSNTTMIIRMVSSCLLRGQHFQMIPGLLVTLAENHGSTSWYITCWILKATLSPHSTHSMDSIYPILLGLPDCGWMEVTASKRHMGEGYCT